MKKKEKYSLTSKQRKQKRNVGQEPQQEEIKFEDLSEDEQSAILAKQEQRKMKVKRFTRLTAVILVAVLAIGMITTGTILYIKQNTFDNEKIPPVATIKLYDGRELNVSLYYNKAPAIVANFIYLALNGYYDDTIFNATSRSLGGFVAMNGYTTDEFKHRSKDFDFVYNLTGFTDHTESRSGNSLFKLSYRFKYINNDPGINSRRGHMAFMSGSSTSSNNATYATATSFLFIGANNAQLNYGSSGTGSDITNAITYMGELDSASLEVLDQIMALEDTNRDTTTGWHYAKPETYPDLKIKSISISKLNRKLKNNILNNFEKFVLNNGDETLNGFGNWATNYLASQLPS